MKGLFLKDMLTFRKGNKITGMIGTVVLLIFFLFMKNEICFYIANLILLPINAATQPSLLSFYDNQWKWKHYMIATPVSAGDIVLSRMLSSFVILLIQSACIELFNLAFFLLNPAFDREWFVFVLLASLIFGGICVLIYIFIDFVLKNSKVAALCVQLVLLLGLAGAIYIISTMQINFVETLLSASLISILGVLMAVLIFASIATYYVCVPAVKNAG